MVGLRSLCTQFAPSSVPTLPVGRAPCGNGPLSRASHPQATGCRLTSPLLTKQILGCLIARAALEQVDLARSRPGSVQVPWVGPQVLRTVLLHRQIAIIDTSLCPAEAVSPTPGRPDCDIRACMTGSSGTSLWPVCTHGPINTTPCSSLFALP